jgi:hypothetical protein
MEDLVPEHPPRCGAVCPNLPPKEIEANPFLVGSKLPPSYAGRLHPRVAGGLAPLLNLQMRAIETTDPERRLAKLEKLLDEAGAEEDLGRKEDRASLSGLADTLNHAGKRYERQGRAETREGPGSSVDPMEATY